MFLTWIYIKLSLLGLIIVENTDVYIEKLKMLTVFLDVQVTYKIVVLLLL